MLQDDRTDYYWFRTRIDRITGELDQRIGFFLPGMVNRSFEVSATCVRKPFTGFSPNKVLMARGGIFALLRATTGRAFEMKRLKYHPLREFLLRQTVNELVLSLAEIERILGSELPDSASLPQWWENQRTETRPQRDAWRDAGFEAFLIKGADRVRFRRVK